MSLPEPLPKAETVLVVEDEVLIRLAIAEYLRHCGFRVIEAVSGDEALIVLQNRAIAVDIVFSDIDLPGTMDGFVLAQWIRGNRPEIDVILAGTPAHAAERAGELCQSGPHVKKPYEPHVVHDRIRRLMAVRGGAKK